MSLLTLSQKETLIAKALEARTFSYSPYSKYQVGAALLCKDGMIYTGCNIENAGYGPTNCAERTAFFKAVSEGHMEFTAIAVAGGNAGDAITDFAYPCGVCRQVMAEFCRDEFVVLVAKSAEEFREHTLEELLPKRFGPANLQ